MKSLCELVVDVQLLLLCKEQRGRMKWRSKGEVLNHRRDRWCDVLLLLMAGSKSTRY